MRDVPLEPTEIRTRDGKLVPLRDPDALEIAELAWTVAGAVTVAAFTLAAAAARMLWPAPGRLTPGRPAHGAPAHGAPAPERRS